MAVITFQSLAESEARLCPQNEQPSRMVRLARVLFSSAAVLRRHAVRAREVDGSGIGDRVTVIGCVLID